LDWLKPPRSSRQFVIPESIAPLISELASQQGLTDWEMIGTLLEDGLERYSSALTVRGGLA
jgi:hypothetical protein